MIRILHVIGSLANGGMETFLLNLYRHIDREHIQFDFVVGTRYKLCQAYVDEITQFGGKIYWQSNAYNFIELYHILRHHPEYKIVHAHRDAMSALYLAMAKAAGVKVRISHSHNVGESGTVKKVMTMALRIILNKVATLRLACGHEAGEHLFNGFDYQVFPNAIDLTFYRYNVKLSDASRKSLSFRDNDIIIGHVGRFEHQKNHEFLVKVFKQLYMRNPRIRFLLIGTGSLEGKVREQLRSYGLEKVTTILKHRTDIPDLLQAMDLVVFPSHFEGFSMAMVEMQAAGLRILASNCIPREINISGNIAFKSLNDTPGQWAETALSMLNYNRDSTAISKLSNYGLDINESVKRIEALYLSLS